MVLSVRGSVDAPGLAAPDSLPARAPAHPCARRRTPRRPRRTREKTLRALLALAALPIATLPAAGQVLGTADAIAVLEVGAPEVGTFLLRGNVPVPAGVFPRADGQMPFGVRDWDGTLLPAQVETVSLYPGNAAVVADVVEVIARVSTPPGTQVGDRLQYSVVPHLHASAGIQLTKTARDLVMKPDALTLFTTDVFGNPYAANLLRGADSQRFLRDGAQALQSRNYEVMRPLQAPTGPPTGSLERFMGVHAYVTLWDREDVISVDLRIHNGTSGHDKQDPIDDPQADLFFHSLDLRVPTGWKVVHDWKDPFVGKRIQSGPWTYYPIVAPNPDGRLHVLPQQSQFHRRIVLTPVGDETRARSLVEEQWLGFVRKGRSPAGRELWSWWNPKTARYYPQRHRLPDMDFAKPGAIESALRWDLQHASDAIVSGDSNGGPIHSPVLGWAHPWGVPYGGQTGGTEIYLYDGILTANAASRDGYRLAQLALRAYIDRHPVALYDKDGEATRLSDWVIHGSSFDYVDMEFYLQLLPNSNDPFGLTKAPKYQADYVRQNGLQARYEDELLGYKPIDLQHTIRLTRSAKTLAWLGNDALAKDELRMQAELSRLSYHDLYTSSSGASLGSGMLTDIQKVAANPGIGFAIGRGEGWIIDAFAAAYSLTDDLAWRAEAKPWFDTLAQLVNAGQANCSGHIMRLTSNKTLNGKYQARKSTETAIIENGLWGALNSVFEGADKGRALMLKRTLRDSAYGMIAFPAWSVTKNAPWSAMAVSNLGASAPPFCTTVPHDGVTNGVDKFQCWSTLAYGYQLSGGDPVFLDRALEMSGAKDLKNYLQKSNFKNIENQAALLAIVQMLP